MTALLRALRPHQWAKNVLVLLPALAAHRSVDASLVASLALAFASFSLLASAVYLVNDVADAAHDRAHPHKRHRPVASGALGVGAALGVAAVLAGASLAVALGLPRTFLWAWLVYLAMTSAYSAALKRLVVLDVVLLSGFYTVRVVAGAAAVDVPLSRWFLAFGVFVFTSLALLKRAVECLELGPAPALGPAAEGPAPVASTPVASTRERGPSGVARSRPAPTLGGRGWRAGDLPVLLAMGAASAMAAALVYCLYITGDEVLRLYARPDLLWMGLPVLLYWLTRAWLLALRGEIRGDPVLFALKDRASWASVALFAVTVWLAT